MKVASVEASHPGIKMTHIRHKLEPHVFDFICDDIFTRLDTKQGQMEVIYPRTGGLITVHKRIWHNVHKTQQHVLFQASNHYANFQCDNNGATAGYGVWSEVLDKVGTFVRKPLAESCIDRKKLEWNT